MAINLIQTKSNEYAYLNDINLTVIETKSDALCPPDLAIKEIISKESELNVLNKELEKTIKLKNNVKTNIIFHEIINTLVYGGCGVIYLIIAGNYPPITLASIISIYYFFGKGLQLIACGTRIGKWKKIKELKEQFKIDEEQIENQVKLIEQLKNEIGYKVIAQMPIEEYERRRRNIELNKNNKLPNTKYLNNNEITLEKYIKIGQKKRR
jgi:hypothetical protein